MWLTLMLAAQESETTGSNEFSIAGEFISESAGDIDATVLVSQEVPTDTGVIEAVELAKGKFSDGEVLLSGMVNNPILVTITVSFDDYDSISTSTVVAPDDDLLFRVLQAEDGTPNRVMFVGSVRLHQNESKKFTVIGDLHSLEQIVVGTTVSVYGKGDKGSINYGTVLVADNGTFKFENEIDEPRLAWVIVQNGQDFYVSLRTILEPQVSVSLVPDSHGTGLILLSDGDYHTSLFDSWTKNEKYLELEEAHNSALAKYQEEMASRQEAAELQIAEEKNNIETKTETSAENEGTSTGADVINDEAKETIPISAVALGISPVKECEHVDLTLVKAGQQDLFEWTRPKHVKIQKEMTRFRDRAWEETALTSDDSMEALLAIELGAFGIFSDDMYRALEAMDKLAPRLEGDLFERRLSPTRSSLEPLVIREINNRNLVPGQLAPKFTLPDIEGVQVSLQETLDTSELVLVEWWASWCGPCIAKFPDLKKLYAAYREEGFQVITVNVDETIEEWKQETEKQQLTWLDLGEGGEDGPVSTSYGILRYPMGYVVDNKGCIVQKDLGIGMLTKLLVEKYGEMQKDIDSESTDSSSG